MSSVKKVALGCFGLLVLIFVIAGSSGSGKKETNQSNPKPSTQEVNYEVLSDSKSGTTNRVEIYTTEKSDDKLIALNDKLFAQYQSGLTHLYIDYFDDKTAAKDYFAKQLDDSISETEKDRLYTHYIANMVYNSTTGLKQLVRQGNPQKILKTY